MINGIEKRSFNYQIERLSCYDISVLEALVDFFRAVKNHDKDTVKKFLDGGMDVNAAIYDESSIYGAYTEEEITAIEIAVTGNDLEMVKLLLEYDVDLEGDINIRKVEGNFTPLMIACAEKNMEMVKLLVEAGADVDVYRFHTTPLILARDNFEITTFLRDRVAIQDDEEEESLEAALARVTGISPSLQ